MTEIIWLKPNKCTVKWKILKITHSFTLNISFTFGLISCQLKVSLQLVLAVWSCIFKDNPIISTIPIDSVWSLGSTWYIKNVMDDPFWDMWHDMWCVTWHVTYDMKWLDSFLLQKIVSLRPYSASRSCLYGTPQFLTQLYK